MGADRTASTLAFAAALSAIEARDRLAGGGLRAVELAAACLDRIAEYEAEVEAWAFLDRGLVLAQAEAADRRRLTGKPIGPLHGLPVGVKDVIDTADMPTENGSAIDAGRRPSTDAVIVQRLRAAGAVILGKTVTAELAFSCPGRTRNPHDRERTPGGSSSGSAAAVAATMVPLAIGTQTTGSVIRPAAFCGVVGFKPTFGLVPRTGVLQVAAPLDTIGFFGRTIEDVALLGDALAGHDAGDPQSLLAAAPRLLDTAASRPPLPPCFAFARTPAWDQIEPDAVEAFAELTGALGDQCDEIELPTVFGEGAQAQRTLMQVGLSRNLRPYYDRGRERLSDTMREAIEEGRRITAVDYLSALDWREVLSAGIERLFDRYDAIITPAAPGEAPKGLESTGNPAFCALWSLCGVPAVSLPLMSGRNGMPLGVQLVGRRGHDGRLLRTARWLDEFLSKRT